MNLTVKQIRNALKDKYGYSDEQLLAGKKELRLQLEKLESNNVPENEISDAFIASDREEVVPSMDSTEWAEYVMGHFRLDEMDNGNPTCDGLRRVTETVIGPIVSRQIEVQQSPNSSNSGTATVICTVQVINNIPDHILYQMKITESDAADVNKYNTDSPYYLHPTATAATRAEARALRKMLRLRKVVAAEELAGEPESEDYVDAWRPSDPVTEEQINLLDVVCQRCDINLMEYINSGESAYATVYALSKNKATSIIQHINKVQQGKVEAPSGVGPYDANWRNNQ